MTKKSLFLLISAFSLAAVSCVREPRGILSGSSSKVVFNIGSEQAVTKAASSVASVQCDPIDVSEEFGIENLVMTEIVTDMGAMQNADPMTKGTPIYTSNLADLYDGKLGVTIYSGTNFATKLKAEVGYTNEEDSNCWSHDYGTDFWPTDGGDLLFVLRAPTDMSGVTDYSCVNSSNTGVLHSGSKGTGTGTITFNYSDPGAGKSNSAELQKDLLFSTKKMNKAQNQSTTHSAHNVLLYHALTGVTFQLKDAGSDNVALTSIDKITINNVVSGGACTIKPVYEGYTTDSNVGPNDVDKSSVAVQWSDLTGSANVSQTYGDDEVVEGKPEAKAEHTFMLVPQNVSDDVTLTIEYTYKAKVANGEWVSYSGNKATLNLGSKLTDKDWGAGKLHTYQFTINQSVNVEIEDAVDTDARTKSSLTISNTGTATSYMRVAVVGNWVYEPEAGEVGEDGESIPVSITPCSQADLADIIGDVIRSGWVSGSDGFYYYKHPVPGGHTISSTNTLFDSVSFEDLYDDDYKPYDECALHVDIAVQAIRADQVAQVWPAAIVTQLDNDVKD